MRDILSHAGNTERFSKSYIVFRFILQFSNNDFTVIDVFLHWLLIRVDNISLCIIFTTSVCAITQNTDLSVKTVDIQKYLYYNNTIQQQVAII